MSTKPVVTDVGFSGCPTRLSVALRGRWRLLNWPSLLRVFAAASYLAAITWMLLAPSETFESVPHLFEHEDKLAHGLTFLALAWLVRWAVPAPLALGSPRFAVLGALALYAGGIERLQPILGGAGRQFEWLDMACNVTGIAAGWVILGAMVNSASKPPLPPFAKGGGGGG